jgi:phosphopantothenoylcysteine decarboxylase
MQARKFFLIEEIEEMRMMGQIEWLCDMDEQAQWMQRGDPVLHIELRKWAQIYLIAPLSANSLAKLANGLCDNLVSLVARCWDMKLREDGKLIKPILVCPAMNTLMWEHPATSEHLTKLHKWGYTIVDPV